jgi:hypothetical protein
MSAKQVMTFSAPPAYGPMYRKILFGRRRPGLKPGGQLPELAAECASLEISAGNLAAFRQVCGITGEGVPVLYPHVMTGSLHFAIMTHDDFPISMMGAVHLRNHILQHRPLRVSEPYGVVCSLDAHRVAKAGIELDVSTVISSGGARVWESISTYFVRGKYGEAGEPSTRAQLGGGVPDEEAAAWHIPPGTGRRYAKVCGDYNPIHLFPITAKLFGFKRDVVHGMWAAAVCFARLNASPDTAVQCDLLFKGPTFTHSDVRLLRAKGGDGVRFDLYCGKNPKPTIAGWWRAADTTALVV